MTLTIAHLSDVHLAPIRGLGPGHVNVKRALGFANWLLKRRHMHLRSVADRIVADVAAAQPDHVIVSGDLTNLGLPGEHAAARAWLETIGPPDRVSVVPGNHDIYCRLWRDAGVERWRDYMASNAGGAQHTVASYAPSGQRGFPYVRVLGRVAIVGVNSAVPTPPFQAFGRIGPEQLDAVKQSLESLGQAGLFRLVVVHHPPLEGQADQRHALQDAGALEQVLVAVGAELVLHGHNHRDMHAVRSSPHGKVHVVGVGSASAGKVRGLDPLARYNLIRIDPAKDGGFIEIETRGLAAPGSAIVSLGRRVLVEAVSPASNE